MRKPPPIIVVASGVSLLLSAAPALGNPYDDCILEFLGASQSEVAVNAVERACINKVSVAIQVDKKAANFGVSASVGNFNTGYSVEYGLAVRVWNATEFDVTEVKVLITHRESGMVGEYFVENFDPPIAAGMSISKLGAPHYRQIIKSGQIRTFFMRIDEQAKDSTQFAKEFSWEAVPTKGIPSN